MRRVGVVLAIALLGCPSKNDKPARDDVSEGEREAQAIRETFRVVLADFHADVVAGNLEAAYARLAPMYRARVPLEKFAAAAKHPMFTSGVTFTTRVTKISSGLATVSMVMNGPMGNAMVDLRCTYVDGGWKVSGLAVDGSPVLP